MGDAERQIQTSKVHRIAANDASATTELSSPSPTVRVPSTKNYRSDHDGAKTYFVRFALALVLTAIPFSLFAIHALQRSATLIVIPWSP